MLRSLSSKLCILLALSSCASPRIKLPEYCSPIGNTMVCESQTYLFPEASSFMCFKPEEIEPFLNKCGVK